jgi:hypothetical protein
VKLQPLKLYLLLLANVLPNMGPTLSFQRFPFFPRKTLPNKASKQ